MAQGPALGPFVPTWSPNGFISALALDGHTLYAGGRFDQVGPASGAFVIVDANDATAINTATTLTTQVRAIVADGNGGWFVASEPELGVVGGPSVDHVGADGTRDPAWTRPAIAGTILNMAADGSRLFIGGVFDTVNGTSRRGVAAFDASTGALLPWNAQLADSRTRPNSPSVWALGTAAGRVYLSGSFTHADGIARDHFAVLDAGTGAPLAPTLPGFYTSPGITSVAIAGTRLYLKLQFSLAAFDLDLAPVPGWTFPAVSEPMAATPAGLYATQLTAQGPRVVMLDLTGAIRPFAPVTLAGSTGIPAGPATLAVFGDRLFIGGAFSTVNGVARTNLAAVDATTGALLPWAPLVGPGVSQVAPSATSVAIGGSFTSAGGVARRNLAAIDLRTGRPTPGAPDVPFPVTALLRLGEIMVVAGESPSGGGPSALAFTIGSGALLPYSLSSDGTIGALATDGRQLFLGGRFSQIGGAARRNLASIDLATATITSWNPSSPQPITVLAVSQGAVFATAAGTGSGGPGPRSMAIDAISGALLPFDPSPVGTAFAGFGFHDNRVLLAGVGHPSGGSAAFQWVDRASGAPVPPASDADAVVYRVHQYQNTIYAAGMPQSTLTAPLITLDAPSGRVTYVDTGLWRSDPRLVSANGDYIVLGGRFTTAAGTASHSLAVFQTPRAGAPQRVTAAVAGSRVTLGWQSGSLPAAISFLVEAGTTFGETDVGIFPVGTATSVSGVLPPGTYFTRVRGVGANGPGAASSEIIVGVPSTPTPPSTPGALTATVAGRVVTLSWGAASGNATTYIVEAGTASGMANVGSYTTGHLDTALRTAAPTGTYFVRVRAANAYGAGAPSNEVTVAVP